MAELRIRIPAEAMEILDNLADTHMVDRRHMVLRLITDARPPPPREAAEPETTKPMRGPKRRAAEAAMPDVIVIKRASDGLPLPYIRVPGGYRSPVGYSSAMPTTPAPVSKLYERDWVPYDPDNPEHRDLPLTEAEARLTKYGQ